MDQGGVQAALYRNQQRHNATCASERSWLLRARDGVLHERSHCSHIALQMMCAKEGCVSARNVSKELRLAQKMAKAIAPATMVPQKMERQRICQ